MNNLDFPKDRSSRYLYKAGAWVAILFLIYSFITIFILISIKGGYPETAKVCFDLIAENKLIALLRLDIVSIIVIPFYSLLFFSLYHALKKDYELIAQIALFSTLAGVIIFISNLNLASILTLSEKYQMTTSAEMKQYLLAACEAKLASDMWISTGTVIRGILIETGAIIFSILMLKKWRSNKFIAWVGILTHSFDLLSIVIGIFFIAMKELFNMLAGPLYILWFILLAIQLLKMGKIEKIKEI